MACWLDYLWGGSSVRIGKHLHSAGRRDLLDPGLDTWEEYVLFGELHLQAVCMKLCSRGAEARFVSLHGGVELDLYNLLTPGRRMAGAPNRDMDE